MTTTTEDDGIMRTMPNGIRVKTERDLFGFLVEIERAKSLDGIIRNAAFSACGRYRWALSRWWAPGHTVMFCMLNPSTADDVADDPTIRRCIGFAKAWGFGSLWIANIFAFRATDPADMKRAPEPTGDANDAAIRWMAARSQLHVAAWGAHGRLGDRDLAVCRLFDGIGVPLHALRFTKAGDPGHPLYLPGDLQPVPLVRRGVQ